MNDTNIVISAKGIVTISSWTDDLQIGGESLQKQIATAIRSIAESESVQNSDGIYGEVSVKIFLRDPKKITTSINGEPFIPEEKVPDEGGEEETV